MEAKVSFSLSARLSLIFIFLGLLLFGSSIFLISTITKNHVIKQSILENQTINSRTAQTIQTIFSKNQNEASQLADEAEYLAAFTSETFEAEFLSFFENYIHLNNSIFFFYSDTTGIRINEENLKKNTETENFFSKWISDSKEGIYNISEFFNQPVLCQIFTKKTEFSSQKNIKCAVAFSIRQISALFSNGKINSSILINEKGEVLADTDFENSGKIKNISEESFVRKIIQSEEKFMNFPDSDSNNIQNIYSSEKIAKNLFLITQINTKDALSSLKLTITYIVSGFLIVIFIGILILRSVCYGFRKRLEELAEALKFVEAGKFNIGLPVTHHDELSVVTDSFNQMALSLEEFKDSNRIAEKKVLKESREYSGTVMNIKIEDFGKLDEHREEKDSKILLDSYLKLISDCISKGKGRIILQNQSEITAIWTDSDFNDDEKNAAWNAVKTTFMLRYSIFVENKARKEVQKKILRLNIGLSSGKIHLDFSKLSESGNPELKGTAAIFASFASDLNKTVRTDIILESTTFSLIGDKLITVQIDEDKTDFISQKYYSVINASGMKGPQTMQQLLKALI